MVRYLLLFHANLLHRGRLFGVSTLIEPTIKSFAKPFIFYAKMALYIGLSISVIRIINIGIEKRVIIYASINLLVLIALYLFERSYSKRKLSIIKP